MISGPAATPAQTKRSGSAIWVLLAIAAAALRIATMINRNDTQTSNSNYDPPRFSFPQPSYQPLPQPSYQPPPSLQPEPAYRRALPAEQNNLDDLIQRISGSKEPFKPQTPPTDREKMSWLYGPAPTGSGVERRKPLDWAPLLPGSSPPAQGSSVAPPKKLYEFDSSPSPPPQPVATATPTPRPGKALPEAPVRPKADSITPENAGLSSNPPPKNGVYTAGK